MDLDAMHKKVLALESFRTRVEKAILYVEGLQAAGGKLPGADGAPMSSEQLDHVIDLVVQQLGPRVTELAGRMDALEQKPAATVDVTSIEDRLTKLEGAPAGVAQNPELAGRVEAMLTWFEANQEGLEVLLSLDGNEDAPVGAGTASGAATGGTGAAPAEGGTSAAPNPEPAPAAPAATDPANPATPAV